MVKIQGLNMTALNLKRAGFPELEMCLEAQCTSLYREQHLCCNISVGVYEDQVPLECPNRLSCLEAKEGSQHKGATAIIL